MVLAVVPSDILEKQCSSYDSHDIQVSLKSTVDYFNATELLNLHYI